MFKKNAFSVNELFKKMLLWCAGVNYKTISGITYDRQKFYSIGMLVLASAVIDVQSVIGISMTIFDYYYLPICFGILLGTMNLVINRLFLLAYRNAARYRKVGLLTLKTFFSLTVTLIISYPLQVILFKHDIDEKISLKGMVLTDNLFARLNVLQEIKNENVTIAGFCWSVTILILLIELLPLLLTSMSNDGAYERMLEMNKYTEIRNEELRAHDQYERLKQKLEKDALKREDLASMPFGGLEFYVDYKTLHLEEINALFSSISNIYNMIYSIVSLDNNSDVIPIEIYRNPHTLFKSHPEDILHIHSIETGNSITFKISTGWKPDVKLIEGDIIVYLPKGSVALLLAGMIVTKMFDYGLSSYKQMLEIEKLRKENKILDNQLLREQINDFNSKLEKTPQEVKVNFQLELNNFYKLTLDNNNFNQTKVYQDKSIVEKMNEGKAVPVKRLKE